MKLYRRGEPNEDLHRLQAANVRAPEEVLGDLHAQVAGNEVGAGRLLAYLDDMDLPDLEEVGGEILGRSERAMRDALRAIPDGDYERTCFVDGLDDPIRIRCRLAVRGDEVTAD